MKIVSMDWLRDVAKDSSNLKMEKIETSKEQFYEYELAQQFPMSHSVFDDKEYWMFLAAHLSQSRIATVVNLACKANAKYMANVKFWIKKEADILLIKAWAYCLIEKSEDEKNEGANSGSSNKEA